MASGSALVLLGEPLDDEVESRLWQKHRDAGETAAGDAVLVRSLSPEVDTAGLPEHLVTALVSRKSAGSARNLGATLDE